MLNFNTFSQIPPKNILEAIWFLATIPAKQVVVSLQKCDREKGRYNYMTKISV
jgi:hypothetical protein